MKNITTALQALLNAGTFQMADLFSIRLIDNTSLNFTNFDIPILYGGNAYLCGGANIERSKLSFKNDLSVNSLDITIKRQASGFIEGVPILQAIKNGVLDGAILTLSRAFFNTAANMPIMNISSQAQTLNTDAGDAITTDSGGVITFGTTLSSDYVVVLFQGRIADIDLDRMQARATNNSWLELLDMQIPRQLYGSGCIHTLYDGPDANGNGCQVNIASYTQPTVITGACTPSMMPTQLVFPDNYFQYGIAQFTSGANAGLQRAISDWISKTIYLFEPLPSAPQPGDTVTVIAGCDKTMATCAGRFNNLSQFLGMPFIPVAETAI
jgi:uncharacterized phage protein (TIGR02218 family)